MKRLDELKRHLKVGRCYRRKDLKRWSSTVDQHLRQLVKERSLQKFAHGLYYSPKITAFGEAPPNDFTIIRSFLRSSRFILTSPNDYNGLGVGTTQLYNTMIVYNHKRQGDFRLGNRTFSFRMKRNFPSKLTREFLLIDLVNNVDQLAEDREEVLKKALTKAVTMNSSILRSSMAKYGSTKTKKLFYNFLKNARRQDTWLSKNDGTVFFTALLNPPAPNDNLKVAMKKHEEFKVKK